MATRKTNTRSKKDLPLDALPYEQVAERLEATVERLEGGELSLEEQLTAFEEGMKLLRAGQKRLDDAERRVEALLADGSRQAFGAPDEDDDEDVEEEAR